VGTFAHGGLLSVVLMAIFYHERGAVGIFRNLGYNDKERMFELKGW
jgi:hypothetical protein